MVPRLIPRISSRSASHSHHETSRSTASPSVLTEALWRNPFQSKSTEDVSNAESLRVEALNGSLVKLADFFPDVKTEVLRELLVRFDGESRLDISVEQLFRYKAEWARGRYNVPPKEHGDSIPSEEKFRTTDYVSAVKRAFRLEFRNLNRSTIDGVLAEVNSSYTRARPILQHLSNQSWATALSNIFRRRKVLDEPPLCLFDRRGLDHNEPHLLATGSAELDEELLNLFVEPGKRQKLESLESDNLKYALAINQREAEDVGALFECQVCFNEVTFESISTCHTGNHDICFDCIRRIMQESVFGQGRAKSVDKKRGTLKCVAPNKDGDCDGYISQALVRRAILLDKSGPETWSHFEEQLAEDSIHTSKVQVVRCPFCSYVEVDQIYDPNDYEHLEWRFRTPRTFLTLLTILFLFNVVPWLLCLMIPMYIMFPFSVITTFRRSLHNASLRKRCTRFQCQNPTCKRRSCLKCKKSWHDPHICHEPLLLSLRTTVESARTAAVKRTCPRCGTSFVKESGCNKLTCVCGYAMCYLCRKNIGKSGERGSEGYRHFCEHFRPNPGQPCAECNRCDLYRAEDEDAVVRQAGEEAEREWRIKEGMVGVQGLDGAIKVPGEATVFDNFLNGNWSVQDVVDWAVDKMVIVKS